MVSNALTPTEVIRYIKRMIGDSVYDIELTDDEIMDIVFQESLITFSKYFPYAFRATLTEKDSVVVPGKYNCYTIPNIAGLRVLGIKQVYRNNHFSWAGNAIPDAIDPIGGQMLNDYNSAYLTRVTYNFIAPNKLEVFPKITNAQAVMVDVETVHPKYLSTIGSNIREYFLKLALYDVLVTIYPMRKRFENMETPYGNITLFLQQVESAAQEREELINLFKENIIMREGAIRIIGA